MARNIETIFSKYQELVDSIFGAGNISIKHYKESNNVIGALSGEQFQMFTDNFIARLIRLKDKYKNKRNKKVIYDTIATIADPYNWEGAYAELVAYDVLMNDYIACEPQLNKTLSASFSLACEMSNRKHTNYDLYLRDYGLYMDVKAWTDPTHDILYKSVIEKAIADAEVHCNILAQYELDSDSIVYEPLVRKLREELSMFLKEEQSKERKSAVFDSREVKGLSYHVLWKAGVNTAFYETNPFHKAEELKDVVIRRYFDKFPQRNPFWLVFVNFPWYNQRDKKGIDNDEHFYRSLARRTFMQYRHSKLKAKDIAPKYEGTKSAYQVSQRLAGIIFIDDLSILENKQDVYVYFNPNAKYPRPFARTYLEELIPMKCDGLCDDFAYDNY